MGWIGRIVLAVIAAVVCYIICYILVLFLPGLPPIGTQVAAVIAKFTYIFCLLVFLWFLFVGYRSGPWSGVKL